MKLTKISIRARLFLGFGILTIVFIAMGIYSLLALNNINSQVEFIAKNALPSVDIAHEINALTADFKVAELQHIISETPEEMKEEEARMASYNRDILENIEKYGNVTNNEKDDQLIRDISQQWEEYLQHNTTILNLSRQQKTNEAMQLINGESKEIYEKVFTLCEELVRFNQDFAEQTYKTSAAIYSRSVSVMVAILLGAVALCIVCALLIINSIVKPIKKLTDVADKLAIGDVNVNIRSDSNDEIGKLMESFESMIENIRNQAFAAEKIALGDLSVDVAIRSENDLLGKTLHQLVEQNNEVISSISAASEQVAAGAKQVSDSSISLAQGAMEQASSIEELTASIDEIYAQTKHNAENANQANGLAEDTKDLAQQGNTQMQEMLLAMNDINESSANISKIIKVIDDIAFQTNILALNAAVEAARAGQHGKGFAVVAEEVRDLAARSANAANETTNMIESSIKKAEDGTKIAHETAGALVRIVDGVDKVAKLISNISESSNEQAVGISQINQGISQVSQVIQSNSATSEQSAAASEELSGQAEILKEQVRRFKLKAGEPHAHGREFDSFDDFSHDKKLAGFSGKNVSKTKEIVLSDNEFGKYK